MKEKKGIIFDMDGTVWDSSENVAKAWTVKIKEAGFDKFVTQDDIKSVMGKPMDVIADTLFTYTKKGKQRNALREACENYENDYLREHGGTLYPDVFETWEKLKKNGYHLYIVSNCQAGYIETFLETSDLDEYVTCHLCPDDTGYAKAENIRAIVEKHHLKEPVYVGDTAGDLSASKEAISFTISPKNSAAGGKRMQ